jgi:hypothetical protein
MATTEQLAQAICEVVLRSPVAIPITLMNQSVEEAAVIIGAVIERCHASGVTIGRVCLDPNLAGELGLIEGRNLPHGARPMIVIEIGLGRQVRFERAEV